MTWTNIYPNGSMRIKMSDGETNLNDYGWEDLL